MGFDVFLEILWTLEGLATKLAAMRLQWDMNTDVGCNVVAFDDLNATCSPRALQVEVVGTLATNVTFTDVILDDFLSVALFTADTMDRCRRT